MLPAAFPEALWRDAATKEATLARWLGADPEGYAAAYRILIENDLRPELASIVCPTLVLAGRHDPFAAPDALRGLAEAMPDGRFAMVDGGHFMAVQSPDLLAAAALAFLTDGTA